MANTYNYGGKKHFLELDYKYAHFYCKVKLS